MYRPSLVRWLAALLLAWTAVAPLSAAEVGFAQDTLGNDWRVAQARALEQALGRHPQIRFRLTNAGGSTAKQVLDVEDLVAAGVDVLLTSPKDGRAMTPVIERVYRDGTPVVLLTRRIEGDAFTSFIAPDDEAIARRAARLIAERTGGEGRVFMLRGVPTASTAIARSRAFLDELGNFPGLTVVADRTANYLRGDAIEAVEEVLREGVGFDAIYAQSDSMASGARMALKRAGIDPGSLVIVGIDYITEAREAIRRGEQTASFTYPLCAKEGAQVVLRILDGKPVPREVMVESTMVTRENVDSVEPIF